MNRLILSLTILLACCSTAWTQNRADSSEVMKQLLAAPAPTPRNGAAASAEQPRPEKFFDTDNVPPDDAPIDDLIAYWTRSAGARNELKPSNTVRHRLLDATIDKGDELARLLPLFPAADEFAEKIKRGFDKVGNDPEAKWQRDEIKKWLVFNSKYFLGELTSLASKVKDNEEGGYVDNSTAIEALAKLDWSTAEPLLQNFRNHGQQRAAALALRLLYEHSVKEKNDNDAEKFRSQLQAIASNRNLPGQARETAIEALSVTPWSGQDDWYLSLFKDESLLLLRDGIYGFSPLTYVFNRDPDKWIPVMTKLVAGTDQTVLQNAASCLVRYSNSAPRRDAMLPVLRWLTEPDWLTISSTERAWFMQKMDAVDMPESVPGLIWIVANDPDHARWAAQTLTHYKDPRAIPALKKALPETSEDDRSMILESLIASGGLTELEQVNGLEAYAAKLTTETGREELNRYRSRREAPLPVSLSIGRYLSSLKNVPESLVRAVLTRAGNLQARNEAASKVLLEIAHAWQSRQIDLDVLKRIAENTADASTIVTALKRREALAETVPAELHALLSAGGVPQGIGTVLLNSPEMAHSILTSGNDSTQIALLASARLTQTPLPVDLAGRLLQSKNDLLSKAAEAYLLAEDSKDARTLLWQHYPNKAFITGWRESLEDFSDDDSARMSRVEEKLRAELFKEDGPTAIFALLTTSEVHSRVVRVYSDKVVFTHYEDESRYRERVVPTAEFATFKEFLTAKGLRDLGPQIEHCYHYCGASEYLELSKEAGRRLFSRGSSSNSIAVAESFNRLGRGEGARIRYFLEKEIKGLEVLYASGTLAIKDVWQNGEDIRIFVERAETDEERADDEEEEDEDNGLSRAKQRRKELARELSRFSWRKLKAGDASSITTAPGIFRTYDETAFPLDDDDDGRRDASDVQILNANTILIARNFDGLWKQVKGRKPVRISGDEGAYVGPIVTPDGKWAVIAKTDTDWSTPNYIVRFDLGTGREFRVNLEPEEQFDPIVFLPIHGKVLLRRSKDEWDVSGKRINQNSPPQYYLLDPKTGDVQTVTGEFAPLRQEGERFLQPTDQPDEYWAAIPDEKQTRVGRYNVKNFSFKPVLTVPQISFESTSMWVDEKEGKLYLVYRNQLLRLPLTSAP